MLVGRSSLIFGNGTVEANVVGNLSEIVDAVTLFVADELFIKKSDNRGDGGEHAFVVTIFFCGNNGLTHHLVKHVNDGDELTHHDTALEPKPELVEPVALSLLMIHFLLLSQEAFAQLPVLKQDGLGVVDLVIQIAQCNRCLIQNARHKVTFDNVF